MKSSVHLPVDGLFAFLGLSTNGDRNGSAKNYSTRMQTCKHSCLYLHFLTLQFLKKLKFTFNGDNSLEFVTAWSFNFNKKDN